MFTNVKNPRSFLPRGGKYEITLVKANSTIGANSTNMWSYYWTL